MCLQCNSLPVYFGKPFPGWTLARARAHDEQWPIGWWGLFRINDPEFVWELTPTPSPTWGMSEEQTDAFWERAEWGGVAQADADRDDWYRWPVGEAFLEAFASTDPETGYALISAAISVGYPYDDKVFAHWLFDYLGHYLTTAEMEIDAVSDGHARERNKYVDHSIGRDPLPSVTHPLDYTQHGSNVTLDDGQRAAIALLVAAQGDPRLDEQMTTLVATQGTTFMLRLRTAGTTRRSQLPDGKAPVTVDVLDDAGQPAGELALHLYDGQIRAVEHRLHTGEVPTSFPQRSHVRPHR